MPTRTKLLDDQLHVKMPKGLKQEFLALCSKRGETYAEALRRIVRAFIEQHEERKVTCD